MVELFYYIINKIWRPNFNLFLFNEQNIQLAPQHWRWKRWYETWLCSRQIGQIKSKRTSSTIATSPALATTSLVMMKESFSSVSSSWLSYFTTVLVVLSVMPFGKYHTLFWVNISRPCKNFFRKTLVQKYDITSYFCCLIVIEIFFCSKRLL